MSFKVLVWAGSEASGSTNAQRWATREEAEQAARDLHGRWMAMDRWEVVESEEPVNYRWDKGPVYLGGNNG